jgi:hypothetical protein
VSIIGVPSVAEIEANHLNAQRPCSDISPGGMTPARGERSTRNRQLAIWLDFEASRVRQSPAGTIEPEDACRLNPAGWMNGNLAFPLLSSGRSSNGY